MLSITPSTGELTPIAGQITTYIGNSYRTTYENEISQSERQSRVSKSRPFLLDARHSPSADMSSHTWL